GLPSVCELRLVDRRRWRYHRALRVENQKEYQQMKTTILSLLCLMVLMSAGAAPFAPGADGPYHFVREITIGGEGGWDYLSIDPAARRLYVTHATKVVVIDIDKNTVVGEIANTPGVHGFAIASKLGRGFSSNGQESKASIVDLKTLQTISKVDTG